MLLFQDQLFDNCKVAVLYSLRSMLEAKAFLLSPAELGGLISLKHTKEIWTESGYFQSRFLAYIITKG